MSHYSILLTGIPVTSERGALGWCTVAYLHLQGRHILFDTGSCGDRSLLLKQLAKLDLCPERIDTVVVSHLHFDHFVNAEIFSNAAILVHKKEIEYVIQYLDSYHAAIRSFVYPNPAEVTHIVC